MTSRGIGSLLLALGFFVIIGAGFYRYGELLIFSFQSAGWGEKKEVTIEIQSGQLPIEISKTLEDIGATSSAERLFRLGKLLKKWKNVKIGEYSLSTDMTPLEVFRAISSGVSITHKVTFPEGKNMFQIADMLVERRLLSDDGKKKEFVSLCKSKTFIKDMGFQEPMPDTLEGYLYPDTYFFQKRMSAEKIIRIMVKRFFDFWGEKEKNRMKEINMSRHDVVTLASIIEKETGASQERALIGSVFHNRLKKRMRLQSDPTTIYGMWETFDGNLKKSDLQTKTPYNTYSISGLPKGPIANPGKDAIHAALFPAHSEYLFFVSKNDGTHYFSKSFKEHNFAVEKFQKNPSARQGKSWRDLNKTD